MQCGCPQCGTFMGQVEKGLNSYCICPRCGYSCSACMGSGSQAHVPKFPKKQQLSRQLRDYLENELDDEFSD